VLLEPLSVAEVSGFSFTFLLQAAAVTQRIAVSSTRVVVFMVVLVFVAG
jgi:hypothetical protein